MFKLSEVLVFLITLPLVSATVQTDSSTIYRITNADINFSSTQTYANLIVGSTYINFDGSVFYLIPTNQINVILHTWNSTNDYLIIFNESSPNTSNNVQYTIGDRQPTSKYSVKIYWNNGTKFQDFYITSNNSGYISYSNTGYDFDRYTVIEPITPTQGRTYPIEIITVTIIIGGTIYYLRKIKKV